MKKVPIERARKIPPITARIILAQEYTQSRITPAQNYPQARIYSTENNMIPNYPQMRIIRSTIEHLFDKPDPPILVYHKNV